jgi:hypothetical protein
VHLSGVLLSNKGGDVALESTSSEAHNDKGDDESRKGAIGMRDGRRDGREHEENVAKEADDEEDTDGLEATELGVCDDGTNDGGEVSPELTEVAESGGGLLAASKRTGNTFVTWEDVTGLGARGEFLITNHRSASVLTTVRTRHSLVGCSWSSDRWYRTS